MDFDMMKATLKKKMELCDPYFQTNDFGISHLLTIRMYILRTTEINGIK